MRKDKYFLEKECECWNDYKFYLTKIESAFETYDLSKMNCKICWSTKYKTLSLLKPEIDYELLEIWWKNENYYFTEQDEDIFMANIKNLDLYLQFLDFENISSNKKWIICSALMVLVFDYSKDKKTQKEIISKILLKKDKILLYKDNIYGYIWRKVWKFFK